MEPSGSAEAVASNRVGVPPLTVEAVKAAAGPWSGETDGSSPTAEPFAVLAPALEITPSAATSKRAISLEKKSTANIERPLGVTASAKGPDPVGSAAPTPVSAPLDPTA